MDKDILKRVVQVLRPAPRCCVSILLSCLNSSTSVSRYLLSGSGVVAMSAGRRCAFASLTWEAILRGIVLKGDSARSIIVL
jgi:hypothetical protein